MTHRSGRAGWTWPWQQAMRPGSVRPLSIFLPNAFRRWSCLSLAPGLPRDPETRSASGRLWEAARTRTRPDPGRGAAGRARAARWAARERRTFARAEGRAGSRQDPLRDARDETECRGNPRVRPDGAPCRGARPLVRSLPSGLWCSNVRLARRRPKRHWRDWIGARADRPEITLDGLLADSARFRPMPSDWMPNVRLRLRSRTTPRPVACDSRSSTARLPRVKCPRR